MKLYDFDKYIDRTKTTSIKHAFKEEYHVPADVIPLWVADMDFRSPDEVCQAVEEAGHFGIFGYSSPKEDYYHAVINWLTEEGITGLQKKIGLSVPQGSSAPFPLP